MKVVVSCPERFHSYDLAAQLNRKGVLDHLITTYPKSEVIKYGVPRNKVHTYLPWEIIKRGWAKWAHLTGAEFNRILFLLNESYDQAASAHLKNSIDVFVGWSSRSEHQLIKAKSLGAITILERGSSHMEIQTELLTEEYERYYAQRKHLITPVKVIEKELREYDIADYISVPSTFVKRTFLAKGFPDDKLIQNPYGVDIGKFTPGTKQDDVFRVIFVGQMSLRKGVHYLLEAFDSLRLKNAELLLVGGMTDEIEPFLKKYSQNVRYVGIQKQDQLKSFYQQSSVFVLCSIEEGLAMVQVQAIACGLPLICTTNTGGEDLIRDGKEGFVIPIRNVDAIREKITWIYEHQEEAKAMGAAARQRVIEGFSWNDYGDRYMRNIETILKRRGSPVN